MLKSACTSCTNKLRALYRYIYSSHVIAITDLEYIKQTFCIFL